MLKRVVTLLACLSVLVVAALSRAQDDQGKPPVYTYLSEWAVPRAQWPDMVKTDEQDRALYDKLVADGTIVSYGAYTNLIHQEGQPTHGTWFSATSEGKLMKALEAFYASPGSTTAPVEGASKHWDYILVSRIYKARPGKSEGGYLAGDQWDVKPGEMREYNDLVKKLIVPVYDKLMADGVVTSYGVSTEDYHQEKLGRVTEYITVADASGLDQVTKAFDDAFTQNPALGDAFQALVDRENHHDFLTRLRFMSNK